MGKKALLDSGVSGLVALLVLALLVACAPAAPAPKPVPAAPAAAKQAETSTSAADFYREKTVTLVVPYGAGGGTDFAARTIASFWTEVTGGAMIVKNMPAGGGLEAMNGVYAAKADGLTLVLGITGTHSAPLIMEQPGVRFDLSKMAMIGDFAREAYAVSIGVALSHKSMEDLVKAGGVLFGATSPRGGEAQSAALAIEFFRLKDSKVVSGYQSTSEVDLAVGRGELQAHTSPGQALKSGIDKKLLKEPFVVVDFDRTPLFPNAPAITELVKLTPQQETWLRIHVATGGDSSKMIAGPPGIPEDRVQFLRQAFSQLMENKTAAAQMRLRFAGWPGDYRKGEDVAAQIQKLVTVPKNDITSYFQIVEQYAK